MSRNLICAMIPYELEKGMDGTKTVLEALAPGQQVAVFIGPEGGFDEEEIQLALKMGVNLSVLESVSCARKQQDLPYWLF